MAGTGMWTGLTPESRIQESELASVFYLQRVMFLISVNPVLSFFFFYSSNGNLEQSVEKWK